MEEEGRSKVVALLRSTAAARGGQEQQKERGSKGVALLRSTAAASRAGE